LHSSPNIIRMMKSKRTRLGRVRSLHASRVLVGMPEEKRLLGRPRRRGEDNIKMYLREIDWRVMD
jgi:hypothetical protein